MEIYLVFKPKCFPGPSRQYVCQGRYPPVHADGLVLGLLGSNPAMCTVGGSMCARGGIHLFTLMDWYSGSWSLLALALLEVIIVAWVFGAERMLDLMQNSMEIRIAAPLRIYWRLTWRFVSPLCIIVSVQLYIDTKH